jgi:hypothetical protein
VCRPLEAGKRIAGKKIEKFRKLRIKVAPSKKTHKSNCKEVLKISMCVEIPIYCSYDDDFFCCFIKKLQLRECIKGWFQTQWNVSNSTTIVSWWWWSFLYVGLIKFNFQGSLDFFIKKNKFKRNLKVCEKKKHLHVVCCVVFFSRSNQEVFVWLSHTIHNLKLQLCFIFIIRRRKQSRK